MSDELPIQMLPLRRNATPSTRRPGFRQFLFRLPEPLLVQICAAAKAMHRTRTGEMVHRLEVSFANESTDEHGVIVERAAKKLK